MAKARKCSQCREPAVAGKSRCQKHLDSQATAARARNQQTVDDGKCQRCRKHTRKEGYKYCQACLDYCKAKTAEHREDYAPRQKELSTQWYTDTVASGMCPQCNVRPRRPDRVNCQECADARSAAGKRRQAKRRDAVFAHYGPVCVCCGETDVAFLQVDHVDGGGNAHRRQIGQSQVYKWLIDNDFPPGYQVLCSKCNFAWGHNSCCPHAKDRLVIVTIDGKEAQQDPRTKKVVRT